MGDVRVWENDGDGVRNCRRRKLCSHTRPIKIQSTPTTTTTVNFVESVHLVRIIGLLGG